MTRSQRTLLVLVQGFLFTLALVLLIYLLFNPDFYRLGHVIASLFLPFLPNLIHAVSKVKISFHMQLVYFVFLFVSLFLGADFEFYAKVPHFDKLMHFVSGALSAVLAWYIIKLFKADKTNQVFRVLFIICFSVTIAVVWEFLEFACDKLLGASMQQLTQVGVDDTMFDMLAASIGALAGTAILVYCAKPIEQFFLGTHKE